MHTNLHTCAHVHNKYIYVGTHAHNQSHAYTCLLPHVQMCIHTYTLARAHTHAQTHFIFQALLSEKVKMFFLSTVCTEIATRLIPIHSSLYSWCTVWICTLLLKLGLFQVWTSTLLPLFFSSPPSFLFGVGDWTQGLLHAKLALCHWLYLQLPFYN